MFTDDQATPARLEILLDVTRQYPTGIKKPDLYRLLQPEPLSGGNSKFPIADITLKAGLELGLLKQDGDVIVLEPSHRKDTSRDAILRGFDNHVLCSLEHEKYFALFYSYYLALGKVAYQYHAYDRQKWAEQFNKDVFPNTRPANPFNRDKLTGLHRWLAYVGLGWYDPSGEFQANPYERLERSLTTIFSKQRKMESQDFMNSLSETCPELDGGALFKKANPNYDFADKKCTLGLSHALVELHLDKAIRLQCPADSHGWSVEVAEPPRDADFSSMRFASIELLRKT